MKQVCERRRPHDRRRRDARRTASTSRAVRETYTGLVAGGRPDRDAAPAQHGHDRRQPVPRHALQLLRPELRVAEGDRLLHEEGRRRPAGWRPSSPKCLAVSSTDTAPDAVRARRVGDARRARDGERAVAVADLYRNDGIHYLTRQPDELLTAVHLPGATAGGARTGSCGGAARSTFPVLSAAAAVQARARRHGRRRAHRARRGRVVAARGARRRPSSLVGRPLTDAAIAQAAELAAQPARPMDNTDFSLHLAQASGARVRDLRAQGSERRRRPRAAAARQPLLPFCVRRC